MEFDEGSSPDRFETSQIDNDRWSNDADTPLPEENDVGPAWFNRILVMPVSPPAKSVGGILIPESVRSEQMWLSYIGKIVSVGPLAYRSKKWQLLGMADDYIPKRGEWWLFDQYQFRRYKIARGGKEIRLFIMHEDSLLMPIPKGSRPWDFKIER